MSTAATSVCPAWSDRTLKVNQINLHVVEAGPEDGPLVILLHGFPEFWYGWRKQIPALTEAGFRVVVPDQRGYNLSDKPRPVSAYSLDALADDCVGLLDALGRDRAALVGHDWGAAAAWWAALKYPQRWNRLCIVNVPHPAVMRRHLRRSLSQIRRSWYMFFFQLPWLPERIFLMRHGKAGLDGMVRTARPGTFADDDLARYFAAWSQPSAMRSMINWYRAALRYPPARLESLRVRVPTLVIWGAQDSFVSRELAGASIDMCDDGQLVFVEEATHWVQHEEPATVNRLLIEFLNEGE